MEQNLREKLNTSMLASDGFLIYIKNLTNSKTEEKKNILKKHGLFYINQNNFPLICSKKDAAAFFLSVLDYGDVVYRILFLQQSNPSIQSTIVLLDLLQVIITLLTIVYCVKKWIGTDLIRGAEIIDIYLSINYYWKATAILLCNAALNR